MQPIGGGAFEDQFWIGNCGVDCDYRREGIASAIVAEAIEEGARRYRADRVFIDAFGHDGISREDAVRFWRTMGFFEIPTPPRLVGLLGLLMVRKVARLKRT